MCDIQVPAEGREGEKRKERGKRNLISEWPLGLSKNLIEGIVKEVERKLKAYQEEIMYRT